MSQILVVFTVVDVSHTGLPHRELSVRATRSHTINDVKLALARHFDANTAWVEYKRHAVYDSQKIGEIVDNGVAFSRDFTIYYEDTVDTEVEAPRMVTQIEGLTKHYPLDTTVAHIQMEYSKPRDWYYNDRQITNEYLSLGDLVQLDVAPIAPVTLYPVERDADYVIHVRPHNVWFGAPQTMTFDQLKREIAHAIGTADRVSIRNYELDDHDTAISEVFGQSPIALDIEVTPDVHFKQMEPLRIKVNNKQLELTGETYEQVWDGNTTSYVAQTDISNTNYTISLDDRRVTLNESQAIIVDNHVDPPYLLLSPSGASKVHHAFKETSGASMLQHVKVVMDAPPPGDAGAPVAPARRRQQTFYEFAQQVNEVVAPLVERLFMIGLGLLVFSTMFNISFFSSFWYYAAGVMAVLGLLFAIFVAGDSVARGLEMLLPDRQPHERPLYERFIQMVANGFRNTSRVTQSAVSMIRVETVRMAVRRPYDFELILYRDHNPWFHFLTWMSIAIKDVSLLFITIFPNFRPLITSEYDEWAREEFDTLHRHTQNFATTVNILIDEYNKKFDPEYRLTEGLDYTRVERVVANDDDDVPREQKYCLLIDCFHAYSRAYNQLNKALATKTPLTGGHLRE